jgi:hypothetical protein
MKYNCNRGDCKVIFIHWTPTVYENNNNNNNYNNDFAKYEQSRAKVVHNIVYYFSITVYTDHSHGISIRVYAHIAVGNGKRLT